MNVRISQAIAADELSQARRLFEEYAAWLQVDLCFQGFAAELAGLPGVYAPPRGRLFLALADAALAGCVALRPLTDGACEMKRLFVRPPFRRCGLGKRLADKVIEDARTIGYRIMRLDTLSSMHPALRLYESLGFKPCPAYYPTPLKDTVFLELQL